MPPFKVALSLSILYEMMCFINNKEPNYEEWEYLCTEGATDYVYDDSDLENFLIENEK